MNISVICPLYNAQQYVENLNLSLLMQKNAEIESINYILTESNDNTEEILKSLNVKYHKIKKQDFSHSLTREKYAFMCRGDILVFITQDIVIKDEYWLFNLTKDIINGNCEAAFSRQLCERVGIEKYIRQKNYTDKSRIVTEKDAEKLGLMTFFFSDASSAIKRDVFVKLKGYDSKDLRICEDMYMAYKLVMNGCRIQYCADSVVIHSHNYTLRQLYKRYYETGIFFKENNYLQSYNANHSGFSLAKYVFQQAVKNKDYKTLFSIIPNFAARFLGMQMGKQCKRNVLKCI
ncbi:glycosyltransferase [Clostridium sp. JN-9]|uniref:glycosyltransferase n=1 Tax=Clostridium sp. JN-9 TaxID=2507159 RepID=UPI000FFE1368|nr:glycosyltransferase [Clostridium sp. JN-9]QAT40507.1 glycosyltransferase [Clostridium sp. JN-9]